MSAHGYHHGEDDGGPGRLDDPQQDQAAELHDGEEVHLPQWDVAKVDEVWLVLGRHAEQPQAIKKLRRTHRGQNKKFQGWCVFSPWVPSEWG